MSGGQGKCPKKTLLTRWGWYSSDYVALMPSRTDPLHVITMCFFSLYNNQITLTCLQNSLDDHKMIYLREWFLLIFTPLNAKKKVWCEIYGSLTFTKCPLVSIWDRVKLLLTQKFPPNPMGVSLKHFWHSSCHCWDPLSSIIFIRSKKTWYESLIDCI